MKIITIVGARPQFIKAAALSRVLRAANGVEELLLHTGQHFDANMSDVFFDELDIPQPDINLDINKGGHGEMTGRMLVKIERALLEHKPDWVLVFGDTNSTLAGTLAAVKLQIPVAHVEAGLRSFNRRMPEEINRVLTDHASNVLYTPTDIASENLNNEGIAKSRIVQVGDVMYDAVLFYKKKAEQCSQIIDELSLQSGDYVLSTIHRAENTDDERRLRIVLAGLQKVNREITVVLPLHPRSRAKIREMKLGDLLEGLKVVDPVGYLDMMMLEKHAALVATDSGGVQKEAFFHGRPCGILRDETEWVELIELGWNWLVPMGSAEDVAKSLLSSLNREGRRGAYYGDGKAAEYISRHLLQY